MMDPRLAAMTANAESIRNMEKSFPVKMVRLDQVERSPFQARHDFSDLDSLTEDIRVNGVLQPIFVRELSSGRLELIAGERRVLASRAAGLREINAVVAPKGAVSDEQALLHGLRENLQRRDLNGFELAQAVVELVSVTTGLGVDDAMSELGSRSPDLAVQAALQDVLKLMDRPMTISSFQRRLLPVLKLPEHLKEAVKQGAAYTTVLELRQVPEPQQSEWLAQVVAGTMTQSDVLKAVAKLRAAQQPAMPRTADWGRATQVRQQLDEAVLLQLDRRKQRKAQRLLEELYALLTEAQAADSDSPVSK